MGIRVGLVLVVVIAAAAPARAAVTVFLDRDGFVTDDGIDIPRFGGGTRTWNGVVACVKRQYAPFAVDFVDDRPADGTFITAVVGGRASLLGYDDDVVNGVGPVDGAVQRDAIVYIFSQVGTGERDVENLCAVTAHEVGHALGLDHEILCGDVMSYYLDRCGARTFMDESAPCGETSSRRCVSGKRTQSSYRRLGELVGFRDTDPVPRDDDPPATNDNAPQGNDVRPHRARRNGRHHHQHRRRYTSTQYDLPDDY
jgi:Matrixin